jgi:hypothetical protein
MPQDNEEKAPTKTTKQERLAKEAEDVEKTKVRSIKGMILGGLALFIPGTLCANKNETQT